MTLEIEKIECFYGTSHILHGVSLSVREGELFAVLGRNGAGKSTLLRSIIGLNPPRAGTIKFGGVNVTKLRSFERARMGIAYVPQGREIVPDITVAENIQIALLGVGRKSIGIPDYILDYFPALREVADRKGGVLSGGQQQQLAIARALVQEPRLLLLDEPTEGLQPSVVAEIEEIIKRIPAERGCAVLLVEQKLDFVRDIIQDFTILETGRIVVQGAIADLTDDIIRRHLSV